MKKIGQGRTAEVFDLENGRVVKLMLPGFPEKELQEEQAKLEQQQKAEREKLAKKKAVHKKKKAKTKSHKAKKAKKTLSKVSSRRKHKK